ncbi:heavy-metal-associated domain-containing protein [Lacisediminihabitans changchengi]|uniref:Heavy-metal-associated domain-containing protein n=1 Tax=Lacisediminihabitans changchengi TaxID=2787634 RepID=A0A934W5V2_9MICO|nr:heavy-metal-associated domain-containing protein [Lacisediminihabitans changchengi]MBK4348945.1 heavy-metal-associated domain-containing protein [Lacisediminihabitans changchengi]
MSISTDYFVTGMTCNHCVTSVTEELIAVDGVDAVTIKLAVGGASTVTVTSSTPIDETDVRAAVAEAGYDLVSV